MTKDTEGQAFPTKLYTEQSHPGDYDMGMTLRDWFAAHCPADWMDSNFPRTIGDIRDEMINRGIIPPKRKGDDPLRSYGDAERRKLYAAIRYDYADAMLAARQS